MTLTFPLSPCWKTTSRSVSIRLAGSGTAIAPPGRDRDTGRNPCSRIVWNQKRETLEKEHLRCYSVTTLPVHSTTQNAWLQGVPARLFIERYLKRRTTEVQRYTHNIQGRDKKGNDTTPHPRPSKTRYVGQTDPHNVSPLNSLVFWTEKGETTKSLITL